MIPFMALSFFDPMMAGEALPGWLYDGKPVLRKKMVKQIERQVVAWYRAIVEGAP